MYYGVKVLKGSQAPACAEYEKTTIDQERMPIRFLRTRTLREFAMNRNN
jgi:hypothetical protein